MAVPGINKAAALDVQQNDGRTVLFQVELTQEEAESVYGAPQIAGWYSPFVFMDEGGNFAREHEPDFIRAENAAIVGAERTRDEWVRTGTMLNTSNANLELLQEVLSRAPHNYRYFVPASGVAGGSGSGLLGFHAFGLRNGYALPGFSMTSEPGRRPTDIEFRGSKTLDETPGVVREEVTDIIDQSGWPASLDDFKD